ncbi:MAG: hypothetical protein HYX68_11185 [Planctomycetes bacterium]|nr:hypothetical protein [Planctomycetota bacterium]
MTGIQTYTAVMAWMLIGLQTVTLIWFYIQADWKPARLWEAEGWFEPFNANWPRSASSSTYFRSERWGSPATGSPDAEDLSVAITNVRRHL